LTGNRCGHDPASPRTLKWAPTHWAIDHLLGQTHKLYDGRNDGIYRGRVGSEGVLLWGARSELAEAMQMVAQVLFKHLRLSDLQIVYGERQERGLSLANIALEADISLDRVSRAIRAFRDLRWIRGVQRRDREPSGEWIHRIKIRWLTYDFFRALGASVVRTINRARGLHKTYQATATVTPAVPASSPPTDPRDSWPDD
jgi:hypothetical protein